MWSGKDQIHWLNCLPPSNWETCLHRPMKRDSCYNKPPNLLIYFLLLLLLPLQTQQCLLVIVRLGGQSFGDLHGHHRDHWGPAHADGILFHLRRHLDRRSRLVGLQRVWRLQHGETLSAVRGLVWNDMEARLYDGKSRMRWWGGFLLTPPLLTSLFEY